MWIPNCDLRKESRSIVSRLDRLQRYRQGFGDTVARFIVKVIALPPLSVLFEMLANARGLPVIYDPGNLIGTFYPILFSLMFNARWASSNFEMSVLFSLTQFMSLC